LNLRKYILLILPLLALLASCSTRQDKWLNRNWHAMNTRYNGYYNGRLAIQEAFYELGKVHKDDYNRPIQVYKYGNKDIAQGVNPQTDRALQKGAKMIKKHSMLINGSQKNRWIDDCYFLIGQANFIKRETFPAIQQFRYVIQSSEDKHMKELARLWMILCYNDMGEFSQAEAEFNHFLDKKPGPRAEAMYYGAMADFFIKSEEYTPAIIPLTKLEKITKKKKLKARYNFIIGQIWHQLGNMEEAKKYYTQAIKYKPEYELEFQAAIAVAVSSQEGQDNTALKKTLKRMLRDDKNIDYRDQIYYAMAILAQKENDEPAALDLFTRSAKASTTNRTQKGMSYLAMADIYYKKPNYLRAQAYFDSASINLDKKHPAFERVKLLAGNLKDIVLYSTRITEGDSLLTMISMSPEEQKSKIEALVQRLQKEDREAKEARELAAQQALNSNTNPNMVENNGKWYFYNPQTVAFGKQEFKKTWGTRKNEDFWRRKNKTSIGGDGPLVEENVGSDPNNPNVRDDENPRYDVNTYLARIPKGQAAIDSIVESIYHAYFNLGLVYKDRIRAYPQAVESFEGLVKRSTSNKFVPEVYYQLYITHRLQNNNSESERYKSILLGQYADSDYARLINDPNYLANKDNKDQEAEKAYTNAFNYFKGKDYAGVQREYAYAREAYAGMDVMPKFSLLNALATGALSGKDAYVAALTETAAAYASKNEGKEAQRILDLLKNSEITNAGGSESNGGLATYKPSDLEKHFYVISVPQAEIDLNQTKQQIAAFNAEYYSNSNLQLQEVVFGSENRFLILRDFPSGTAAITYYKSLDANSDILEKIPSEQVPVAFAISTSNFVTLMKTQLLPEYMKFFFETYKFN